MLSVTNTLSGKKELLSLPSDRPVTMYVCGITPYDRSHLGHGRCYVAFDVLLRMLSFYGYDVIYCRNFTDIDDKLLAKAIIEYTDQMQYPKVAQHYIDLYHVDMQALNCLPPTIEPRVTETIPEIISFIEQLIAQGYAYVVEGDVYFSVDTDSNYGKLSKRDLDDLRAGARVEINDKKKNPLDFALWKGEADQTFWPSPWGYGRPGWHIECSAMALKFLGEHIDIHGGGLDLIFPHHENEIAQSECRSGKQFATYWMHNGFVNINRQKMSKSLGNFFTLADIFVQYDPMVVRFYFLTHQYHAPLDFSYEDLEVAKKTYQRIVTALMSYPDVQLPAQKLQQNEMVQKMLVYMNDDLNTVGALGVLFEHLSSLSREDCSAVKQFLKDIYGLILEPIAEKQQEITPEIEQLLAQRQAAREARDWKTADLLRDKIVSLGYKIQDKKI